MPWLGLAAVATATATGVARATESTIVPGVGIGRVRLGMTQVQVKRALGQWRYRRREDNRLTVGWGFASWTVVLIGGRVVEVDTTVHAQRTKSGIGPGSAWLALARAYPHGICRLKYEPVGPTAELLVPHKGRTQTIFYVLGPRRDPYQGQHSAAEWHVGEVHVRTPWTPLPEFTAQGPIECNADWRTGAPG